MKLPILLVDGNNLAHRSYHAHRGLSGPNGPTSILYGVPSMLTPVLRGFNRVRMVFAWDAKPYFRSELWPGYKDNRKRDPVQTEEIGQQVRRLRRLLGELDVEQYFVRGLEADDIIGLLSRHFLERGRRVLILSKDTDLLQLVTDNCEVLWPADVNGARFRQVDAEGVKEMLGVYPRQVPLLKALAGDTVDNFKPVAGVGPKTAITLLTDGVDPREPKAPKNAPPTVKENWAKVRLAYQVAKIVRYHHNIEDPGIRVTVKSMLGEARSWRPSATDVSRHAVYSAFRRKHLINSEEPWLAQLPIPKQ